jgi:pSer/pThr/pTyr-binding forkhead associated (FHA) protein
MWKLVIEDDEGKRTVVPLTREDYTIGRQEGNTIRLTERNVSRKHAKLKRRDANGAGAGYLLEDLASYNGVYVNGLRVAKLQDLVHGDLVQIGDYRIILQDDAVVEPPTAIPQGPAAFDPKATVPTGLAARGSLLMERPNRLVMLAGPTPGAEFPLTSDRLTVGRAEDANISINHNSVSRLHCEIHALGEGRFEIVDKGSSNGVRVNGADLRRGIIEAGDIIELGDVRFKFVGAGQIFIPGSGDSQQLQAIGDRVPGAVDQRKGGSLLPYALFGLIVAMAAIGVALFFSRRQQQHDDTPITNTSTVPPDPLDYERPVIAEAKRLCLEQGDCETAHEKLNKEVRESSPLRESTDFKEVETKWGEMLLQRGDAEPDLLKRKTMYGLVARAMAVDPAIRKTATDRLQALDDTGTSPTALPTVKDAGSPLAMRADAGARTPRVPVPQPTSTPTPPETAPTHTGPVPTVSSAKQPQKSPFDQASDAVLKQNYPAARAILEPRVMGGRASPEEIKMLKDVCKATGDQQCVEYCKAKLKGP